jgi:YD repeat-containing protein
MKHWKYFLFFVGFAPISFLFSEPAHAMVDMRNANYSNTWVDLELAGTGYDLRVTRTYNSRTLFNGIFGFGWCSDFETKLDVTPEGNLKLTECGAGKENFYMPREYSRKDVDKTVNQIIAALKAKHKDEKSLQSLAKDLVENNDLRAKYAFELKIAIPVKEGTRFYSNGQGVENVVFEKGIYTRTLPDSTQQRFTKEGHLTHIYDKNGNYIKVEYDKDLIKEISDNSGRKLAFKFFNNKKVKSITGPNGLAVEYKFEKLDDLVWVHNAWKNVYTYQYDELHDLVKASWPDGTSISLTYDKKHDWVTSFTDREKCREDYNYEDDAADPKNHYWSVVKKTCGKEVIAESRYEFWYKQRPDGSTYLQKVNSIINGNSTEITYHEIFGRPINLRRNGDTFTYDYLANGLVKTKTGKFLTLTYEYYKDNNKVSQVTAAQKNEKGQVVKTLKSEFKYDTKGNLTFASNTEGQKIEMTYDPKGRIATIKDQAKKIVKIDYDEKSGRPAVVTRPGLGTIHVSYKASGEIDKVNSSEGPAVAMQVASAFNNLLEVIAPASAEVYN